MARRVKRPRTTGAEDDAPPEKTMTTTFRTRLLRGDAAWLLLAALGGLGADVLVAFFARGPLAPVLGAAPETAIGSYEAHGLAAIIAVLLWRAAPERPSHALAATVHLWLGTSNLLFWQMFITTQMLVLGYITTFFHFVFAAFQLSAALSTTHEHEPSKDLLERGGETG
jgi:hypothetical protein